MKEAEKEKKTKEDKHGKRDTEHPLKTVDSSTISEAQFIVYPLVFMENAVYDRFITTTEINAEHAAALTKIYKKNMIEKIFDFINNPMALSQTLHMPENHGYHNVGHALGVAATAVKLAETSDINPLYVSIAGLFHDAGHLCSATNPDHRNLAHSVET